MTKKTALATLVAMAEATLDASKAKGSFRLVASANNDEPLTLYLYGDVGWYNFDGIDMKCCLIGNEDRDINVYIHTDGGDVDEGLMIYNLLKGHKGKVTGIVDGHCYSIGVPILMACDVIYMRPASKLMMHEPHGGMYGSIKEHEDFVEYAKKARTQYAEIVATRTGKDVETVLKDMDHDNYFLPEEAIEYGLCDHVLTDETLVAKKIGTLQACLQASGHADSESEHIKKHKAKLEALSDEPNTPPDTQTIESSEPQTTSLSAHSDSDNSQGEEMADPTKKDPTKKELLAQFVKDELARKTGLNAAAKPFLETKGVKEKLQAAKDDPEFTVEKFNTELLTMIGSNQEASVTLEASKEKTNKSDFKNFLQAKLGASNLNDDNCYSDCDTLLEALKAHHKDEGYDPVRGKSKLIAQAYNNDKTNLGDLFEEAMQIIVDNEVAKQTPWHEGLVERRKMSIGQATKILKMTDVVAPSEKTEHGEIKHVRLEASKEVCSIAPFALKLEITKEVIVNDDFDFIARNLKKLVQSVAMQPQRLLMSGLLNNLTMADGSPIFSKGAGNLFETPELDADTIAIMSGELEDMLTDGGEPLELVAQALLSSNAASKSLSSIINSDNIDNKPNKAFEAFNEVRGTARLKGKDKVFGFAGDGFTSIIEGYVPDEDGVQIEKLPSTKLDGVTYQLHTYSAIYFVDRKGLQCWSKKVA